jgi:hypothetical protein
MMKKFYVILVVLAMVCISSMALAADVTVGGTVQLRSREFNNLSFDDKNGALDQVDTQERVMVDVNAKSGDVKAKISIERLRYVGQIRNSAGHNFGTNKQRIRFYPYLQQQHHRHPGGMVAVSRR